LFAHFAFTQVATKEKIEEIAVIEQKVMMPMRDGKRLATDIYRPKTDKPVPIITGGDNYNEKEGVVAHNKIHHSSEYPSHIQLPIVK
jgi:predicted acyl esterase